MARSAAASWFRPRPADDEVQALTLADEKIKAAIEGKEIVKVLVVKGRLVNIAVK